MPTTQKPKQTKATQKVGGKAPVPQAKAIAKTQGGKSPTTSAKASAKTQGGKAPTTSAKAPAKTGGTDGTRSQEYRAHVESLLAQTLSPYNHNEMNIRSHEYATIGEMVYYVRNIEQNINQAFIKSFNELSQAFTKNFGEVSNDLNNHKKYVESKLTGIHQKIDKLENQLKNIEETMNFNNKMNDPKTNPLSTKLKTLEAKLERLNTIVIGLDKKEQIFGNFRKHTTPSPRPQSRQSLRDTYIVPGKMPISNGQPLEESK